jgi:hypothetical protein
VILSVNKDNGALDDGFSGHEGSKEKINPAEAFRRVNRARSNMIIEQFLQKSR